MLWAFSRGAEEGVNQIHIDSHNFGEGPELLLHSRFTSLAFPLLWFMKLVPKTTEKGNICKSSLFSLILCCGKMLVTYPGACRSQDSSRGRRLSVAAPGCKQGLEGSRAVLSGSYDDCLDI